MQKNKQILSFHNCLVCHNFMQFESRCLEDAKYTDREFHLTDQNHIRLISLFQDDNFHTRK